MASHNQFAFMCFTLLIGLATSRLVLNEEIDDALRRSIASRPVVNEQLLDVAYAALLDR